MTEQQLNPPPHNHKKTLKPFDTALQALNTVNELTPHKTHKYHPHNSSTATTRPHKNALTNNHSPN